MNIYHIHHRSKHHAENSGYSRLSDYLQVRSVIGSKKFPYKLAKKFSEYYSDEAGIYDAGSSLKEIDLFKALIGKKSPGLVHYLNAERDIRNIIRLNKLFHETSFCGTFHKPSNVLRNSIKNTSYLRRLDGAIAVGINQVDFLKDWLKLDNVKYIPHGVDTNFFNPSNKERHSCSILFVGQHLRDFETFNFTVGKLLQKIRGLTVNVVIHKAYTQEIIRHKQVQIYTGVNDIDLRDFYQTSSLMYLPLTDVTACNSILEAMACGLPIVTTEVGGNKEYLKGTRNLLLPGNDKDAHIETIINLLHKPNELFKIGSSSRKKVMTYEWKSIARKTQKFYEDLN